MGRYNQPTTGLGAFRIARTDDGSAVAPAVDVSIRCRSGVTTPLFGILVK
jgi:hypothetical protein